MSAPRERLAWSLAIGCTVLAHGAVIALPIRIPPPDAPEMLPLSVVFDRLPEPPPPTPPKPPPPLPPSPMDRPPPVRPTAPPPIRRARRRPARPRAAALAQEPKSLPDVRHEQPPPAPTLPARTVADVQARAAPVDPVPPPPPAAGPDMSVWGATVRSSVLQRRRYPRAARRLGLEGTAVVSLLLWPDGRLAGPPRLQRSSGHEVLDHEALRMVRAAAPFAPPTGPGDGAKSAFSVPIRFALDQP
jgi:protein TonB